MSSRRLADSFEFNSLDGAVAALGYRLATNFPPRGNNAPAASARLWWGLAPTWRRQREGGAAGLATGAGKPVGRLPLPGRSGHLAGGGRLGNARGRVLHLEPVRGAPGAVGASPRASTQCLHLADMSEHDSAGVAEVLVQALASVALRISSGSPQPFTIKLALSRRKQGFESLGSANDFSNLAPKWSPVWPASPTFLQWTVL